MLRLKLTLSSKVENARRADGPARRQWGLVLLLDRTMIELIPLAYVQYSTYNLPCTWQCIATHRAPITSSAGFLKMLLPPKVSILVPLFLISLVAHDEIMRRDQGKGLL